MKALQYPTVEELAILLWLKAVPRIGPAAVRLLLTYYQTPLEVFRSSNYEEVPGLRPHMVEELVRAPKTLDGTLLEAEQILSKVEKLGIAILTPMVSIYPKQLLDHPSYGPSILYVVGDATCLSLAGGAIVGTRSPSVEAKEKTRLAAAHLVQHGQVVFSGMAKGIDAEGHWAALDSGGRTVAVLGCGVDRIYPAENADLYKRILTTGAIVSEYLPNTPPSPENLRRRNKLIVGLSRFVLVAECPSDSGAMIAARSALQQQRPLLVLTLNKPGFEKERNGTDLLCRRELAASWDGQDVDWLFQYNKSYKRPSSAETRLDEALGKKHLSDDKKDTTAMNRRDETKKKGVRQASPSSLKPGIKEAQKSSNKNKKNHSEVQHLSASEPPLSLGLVESSSSARNESQQASTSPGSVVLTKNQRVRHPIFGTGVIKYIDQEGTGLIEVRFDTKITKKFAFEYAHLLEAL